MNLQQNSSPNGRYMIGLTTLPFLTNIHIATNNNRRKNWWYPSRNSTTQRSVVTALMYWKPWRLGWEVSPFDPQRLPKRMVKIIIFNGKINYFYGHFQPTVNVYQAGYPLLVAGSLEMTRPWCKWRHVELPRRRCVKNWILIIHWNWSYIFRQSLRWFGRY